MQGPFKSRLLLLAALIIFLIVGVMAARMFLFPPTPVPTPVAVSEPPRQLREVLLYFATADGAGLETEMREIDDCQVEEDCLRGTLQGLVDGPAGELVEVVSPRSQVQKVSVDGATATVSFSRELITGHPGGSMTELLTVHALSNTLAVNFPHIRQVRILVDGAPLETLKGHVNLREPIAADFDFGRPLAKTGTVRPEGE